MTLSNVIVEFYEKMSTWETSIVDGSGLSLPQMHTIEILGYWGDLRMKELASKIGVTTGTLTITIDKLEKKGLVERIPNPTDRRSFLIALTKKGTSIHKEHNKAHDVMTSFCTDSFNNDELALFKELLQKFSEKIIKIDNDI